MKTLFILLCTICSVLCDYVVEFSPNHLPTSKLLQTTAPECYNTHHKFEPVDNTYCITADEYYGTDSVMVNFNQVQHCNDYLIITLNGSSNINLKSPPDDIKFSISDVIYMITDNEGMPLRKHKYEFTEKICKCGRTNDQIFLDLMTIKQRTKSTLELTSTRKPNGYPTVLWLKTTKL